MQTSPPRIFLGRVIGAHGIRGELKVRAETDSAEILLQIGEVEIDGRHYQVTGVRPHKQHLLLSLAGINTRNQAEALIGQDLRGNAERLPPLPAGEYYWHEILGLDVYRADTGAWIGRVMEIIPTAAHDVYVVREGDQEYLIPAREEVIQDISLEQGWMTIDPNIGVVENRAD
ncbi:MAG: 16S rRNA processing protein RimM [Deltaproteobacteria bacterium]|nr:16S rRNA processing protein RimM [Deltaproteobacteria bacterium]